jgi:hypothetical protein
LETSGAVQNIELLIEPAVANRRHHHASLKNGGTFNRKAKAGARGWAEDGRATHAGGKTPLLIRVSGVTSNLPKPTSRLAWGAFDIHAKAALSVLQKEIAWNGPAKEAPLLKGGIGNELPLAKVGSGIGACHFHLKEQVAVLKLQRHDLLLHKVVFGTGHEGIVWLTALLFIGGHVGGTTSEGASGEKNANESGGHEL